MNFILCIIKFTKFKPITKFKTFERHNYDHNISSCVPYQLPDSGCGAVVDLSSITGLWLVNHDVMQLNIVTG